MASDHFFNADHLPPTGFYFALKFVGFPEMDARFQEVYGIKLAFGIEERKEGDENEYVHHLPNSPAYDDLVLKRCLVSNSHLNNWCKSVFEDFNFEPKDINLQLLGADGGRFASWNIIQAYPISWELAALNSTSNELAIETLTLKYLYFKRDV